MASGALSQITEEKTTSIKAEAGLTRKPLNTARKESTIVLQGVG
jgi:hypothetical protein